jgi:ribonucleoside-diphosphate reductase alpha chain
MKSTYTRNDPGVLFLDIANKLNPLMYAEKLHVSNPCGEVIMSTGVCNLCSLNLVKFIEKKNNSYSFNFDLFKKAVSIAVRFADNINDISRTPIVDYKKSMIEKRRIGLGVLGLGSLMYILGIRFGSKKSLKLIEDIFKAKCETELLTSAKLGVEKGSFKLFDKEKYFNSFWWKTLPISEEIKSNIEAIGEMRNSHLSANAPTGNMSIYAGVVSGGIEPVFMKEYARWSIITEGDRIELRNNGFKFPDVFKGEWFETDELKFSQAGTDQVLLGNFNGIEYQVDKNRGLTKKTVVQDYGWQFVKHNFSQEQIDKMQEDGVFATTEELSVEDHINSLKVIAKYVSMNSSKTVNIPNDYPYDKFQNLYFDAWKSGIKGLTSYRAGTMTAVLEKDDKKKRNLIRPTKIMTSMAPKRPQELSCEIHQASVKGQKWTVLVGLFDGAPYEIFMGHSETLHLPSKCSLGKIVKQNKGKYNLHVDFDGEDMIIKDVIKTFDNAESAWATRMISMSLRHGVPIDFIVDQLARDGIITDVNKVTSRILKKYIKDGLKVRTNIVCESCGSDDLIYQEGCALCKSCNNSKCG